MSLLALTRLTATEGRGAWSRLVATAASVAIGVALLVSLWGTFNGLATRAERSTWTSLITASGSGAALEPPTADMGDDVVLASTVSDTFDRRTITRVDIASSPASTVVVPGVGEPPDVGTYYASPALLALIDSVPADQLGDRYGRRAGVVADSALSGPDSLVVVTGVAAEDLDPSRMSSATGSGSVGVSVVSEFRGSAFPSTAYRTVAIVGGLAILLPVLILVGTVTRLGAAQRTERFAALRLIGATPRTVADIAAVETGAVTLVGALAGVVLAWLFVPLTARVPLDEGRFFRDDLTVGPVAVVSVVVGVVVVCAAVAWWRTARAGIGPLGTSREHAEQRPTTRGVTPLVVGAGLLLAAMIAAVQRSPLRGTELIVIAGFVLTLIGLMTSGPILTYWVARLVATRARTAAGVIAMHRIQRHPRAAFRSVSGLVAALFVVSVFAAAVTTAAETSRLDDGPGTIPASTLVARLGGGPEEVPAALAAAEQVSRTPGVDAAVIAFYDPENGLVLAASDAAAVGLSVPDDATHIRVAADYLDGGAPDAESTTAPDTMPAALLVVTDGARGSVERARTAVLGSDVPLLLPPTTTAEATATSLQTTANRYAGLADVGILVATVISGISLAVSTVAAVLDRKRVLGLLRLMGMPAATVRRLIMAEAALPLATVFGLCVGLGFLVAWCILAGLTAGRRSVSWPDPSYYLVLAAGLGLAALAVAATFRTATRNTSVSAVRFE